MAEHSPRDSSAPGRPLRGRDIFGTEDELAEFLAHRTVIDQAKGMLMFVYDIDSDRAFEILKWRSQITNVKLRALARQLLTELPRVAAQVPTDLRSASDRVLLTVHERARARTD